MTGPKALDTVAASVRRELRASGYPNVPSISGQQREELKQALMRLHEIVNRDPEHEAYSLARQISESMY